MQVGSTLEFSCLECKQAISFSVLNSKTYSEVIFCKSCNKRYAFDNETIINHLKKFEALCQQIHASQDILGNTHVAVNVGNSEVKIPYKILLTRLSSVISLKIEDYELDIRFRLEPIKDLSLSQSLN